MTINSPKYTIAATIFCAITTSTIILCLNPSSNDFIYGIFGGTFLGFGLGEAGREIYQRNWTKRNAEYDVVEDVLNNPPKRNEPPQPIDEGNDFSRFAIESINRNLNSNRTRKKL